MLGARTFAVAESFETIQGEGCHAGTPAFFIRLQGCDVGCPWCDTKYSWPMPTTHNSSVDALSAASSLKHTVITGGEPAMWDLGLLCARLEAQGKVVQLETSGTYPLTTFESVEELTQESAQCRVSKNTWVTVSPKLNMPGKKTLSSSAMLRANEIKFVVGKQADIAALKSLLTEWPHSNVWVQPMSQSANATQLAVAAAMDNGWRVSVQTHKYVGWR